DRADVGRVRVVRFGRRVEFVQREGHRLQDLARLGKGAAGLADLVGCVVVRPAVLQRDVVAVPVRLVKEVGDLTVVVAVSARGGRGLCRGGRASVTVGGGSGRPSGAATL